MGEFTLANILRLYRMYMITGSTGLMPHGFGPPGVGKTWILHKAAELLGVNLHVMSVARLSPLESEGIQMPVDNNERLEFLIATFWTQIQEGDIVFWEEFLRGHPEVYNALLDVQASRVIAGFKIPKSFWIGASNSIATYDPALEDRLIHIPVPDIRVNSAACNAAKEIFVKETGMHPGMVDSIELNDMFYRDIFPMYAILDDLKNKRMAQHTGGYSLRNLISQVHLRQVQSTALKEVIWANNRMSANDVQYQIHTACTEVDLFEKLLESNRLTDIQRKNALIHLELAEMSQVFGDEDGKDYDEDDIFS